MEYTHNITSKGQITLPKELRQKLGLDEIGRASIRMNHKSQIIITKPKTLQDVRAALAEPTLKDELTEKEKLIGTKLAKKHGVH